MPNSCKMLLCRIVSFKALQQPLLCQDDQNNSRLPTEGPLWTAELATDPNQPPDGQNRPMYLRLLRRQPEQLVNLDKERGYVLLPSKQLASALGSRSSADVASSQNKPSNHEPPSPAFNRKTAQTQERVFENRGNVERPEEHISPTRVSVSNLSRDRHRMSPLNREQIGSPPSTASSSDNGYGSPYRRHESKRGRRNESRERNMTDPGFNGANRRAESPQRNALNSTASLGSAGSKRTPNNNNNIINNSQLQIQSAPGAVQYDSESFINETAPTDNKAESRRSSAHSSATRSGDSAIGSIGSNQTLPTVGQQSNMHYFDPFETPLPYRTKSVSGPFFINDGVLSGSPGSPTRRQPQPLPEAPQPTPPAISPAPLNNSVHSSPRRSLAPSPERSNSPPIRPQTSSPIPLQQMQQQKASPSNHQLPEPEYPNPMERPLPLPVEPSEQPPAPTAFAAPMMPKARPARSTASHIPRRPLKSNSLNRGVRNSSAHSSSSSLMDDMPPTPFRRPHDVLSQCKMQLDSPDWTTIIKALKTLNYLVEHHPDVVTSELHTIVTLVVTQIKNLRSQVSRNACLVAGNMAIFLKKALEIEVEDLVAPLLHRSADTTKFHRKDCNEALDKIMQNIAPMKTLAAVISQGSSHKNAVVRTTAARLLAEQVQRMGADKVMTYLSKDVRVKLLRTTANFLTEGSQETRDWAKKTMQVLVTHELFEAYLEQAVSPNILRTIDKTLKVLKGKMPMKK